MENTNNNSKNRVFEISLLNVFFCFLVVFIHASSNTVTELDRSSWQYLIVLLPWRLSAFVVQGFIFLSGLKLFLKKPVDFSYGKFFARRFVSIFLPYVLWVFIYYMYFWTNGYFDFSVTNLLRYIFVGDLVSHFYFIVIIIQFYLLAPIWFKLVRKENALLLIVFSLMITIITGQGLAGVLNVFFPEFYFRYTDRVFATYLIYWIAGCLAGLYYESFITLLKNNRLVISIMFIIVTIANGFFSYLTFSGAREIYFLENIHILYCISAILFFYLLAIFITDLKASKFKVAINIAVKNIDRISYGIYLSHCLAIFIANDKILSKFQGLSLGISYLVRLCAAYIFTISLLLLWDKVRKFVTNLTPTKKSRNFPV